MRGRNIPYAMEFNGHRRNDCVLTCLSSGTAEYWSIDVPSVLWILERVAAGMWMHGSRGTNFYGRRNGTAGAAASATLPRRTMPKRVASTRTPSSAGRKNSSDSSTLRTTHSYLTKEGSTPCVA